MPPQAPPPAEETETPFPPTNLIVGATAAAVAVFAMLWADANWDLGLNPYDRALEAFLAAQLGPATRSALGRAFSMLGDTPFLVAAAGTGILGCVMLRRYVTAAFVAAYAALGWVASTELKRAVGRVRPDEADAFSFPSGHASGSMLVYGLVAAFLLHAWYAAAKEGRGPPVPDWARPTFATAWLLITGLVGVGRLVGGYHWFTDVLAGWSLGFTLVCAAVLYHERVIRRMTAVARQREAAQKGRVEESAAAAEARLSRTHP